MTDPHRQGTIADNHTRHSSQERAFNTADTQYIVRPLTLDLNEHIPSPNIIVTYKRQRTVVITVKITDHLVTDEFGTLLYFNHASAMTIS